MDGAKDICSKLRRSTRHLASLSSVRGSDRWSRASTLRAERGDRRGRQRGTARGIWIGRQAGPRRSTSACSGRRASVVTNSSSRCQPANRSRLSSWIPTKSTRFRCDASDGGRRHGNLGGRGWDVRIGRPAPWIEVRNRKATAGPQRLVRSRCGAQPNPSSERQIWRIADDISRYRRASCRARGSPDCIPSRVWPASSASRPRP